MLLLFQPWWLTTIRLSWSVIGRFWRRLSVHIMIRSPETLNLTTNECGKNSSPRYSVTRFGNIACSTDRLCEIWSRLKIRVICQKRFLCGETPPCQQSKPGYSPIDGHSGFRKKSRIYLQYGVMLKHWVPA